jgi:hypothetical protein
MVKQPSHAADTLRAALPPEALNGRFLEALMHGSEAYTKAILAWQTELLRFLGSQLQWDGRVGEALAKCRTLAEVAEVQRDWAMTAARDYVDELDRLTQLAAKIVPSWMPVTVHRAGGSPAAD